jgi:hypothetical protein
MIRQRGRRSYGRIDYPLLWAAAVSLLMIAIAIAASWYFGGPTQ